MAVSERTPMEVSLPSAPRATSDESSGVLTNGAETHLSVEGLRLWFPVRRTRGRRVFVRAVDDVSFAVGKGETVGLVGESGSGKTTVALAVLQLLRPDAGRVVFEGHDLTALKFAELQRVRRDIQIIFQDPYSSLNPRMTIRRTLREPLIVHGLKGREHEAWIDELVDLVGLPRRALDLYPHEFSGGQRQRIAIARALALRPKLIICDEPVSALDVSIRAQVLNLLKDLQDQFGLTYVLISHDLSVVKHWCDRVLVMYRGRIAETGSRDKIFSIPRHPYTQALLAAIPIPDPVAQRSRTRIILQDDMQETGTEIEGCRFSDRCPYVQPYCREVEPMLEEVDHTVSVACHYWRDLSQ